MKTHEGESDFPEGTAGGLHENELDFTPAQLRILHELMSDFLDEWDRRRHQTGRGAPPHPAWTEEGAEAFAKLLLEGLLRADAAR